MNIEFNVNTEPVSQLDLAEPLCVPPETTVREVFGRLKQHRSGCVLVTHDSRLIGIFTERDALRMMAAGTALDAPISQVMVVEPVTLRATDTVGAALERMSSGHYRRLPIVDEERRPLGVLQASAIVHYLVEHFPSAVYNLPPSPHLVMTERDGA